MVQDESGEKGTSPAMQAPLGLGILSQELWEGVGGL